ncbi:MAG: LamG domain-containing protein [Deltaproteobacteria bacterium]|nr:LamG domain-containing protein [Deltaproteobacteria bacterium]
MAIGGVEIGQELLNVPMGDMIRSMALAIADAQLRLNKNSMMVAEFMSGQRVLRDPQTGQLLNDRRQESTDPVEVPVVIDSRVYFGFDIVGGERVPKKVSMMELGFAPTFYQFVDTIIEVKISVTITGVESNERSQKGVNRTEVRKSSSRGSWSWWWWGGGHSRSSQSQVTVEPVDAKKSTVYQYSAEGSSLLRTKLVPIPTPAVLDERIRWVMEQERLWAEEQRNLETPFKETLGGLWFNGFDTCVTLDPALTGKLKNDAGFTVEAFIKVDNFNNDDETILGNDGPFNKNKAMHLALRDCRGYLGFYGNDLKGTTILSKDVWYHVAFRYTKNGGQQAIFIDGSLEAVSKGHDAYAGDQALNIGRWGKRHYFNGYMDEVIIWSKPLPVNDIKASSRKENRFDPARKQDLLAYYKLDQYYEKKDRKIVEGGDPLKVINQANAGTYDGTVSDNPRWTRQ